ncbi:hypothetical protein [Aquimarina celericrescens]|uniref:Transcriptional regulator n=1 Tax=Aquimarina celericrescens TaxID=1964542 RepID=A0ABW5B0J5_9FLAO|nr:hypothetical protein [Aquimarina celericrescens]
MHKSNIRQRVEHWLLTYGHLINKNALEREIGVSKGMIQKFTKYGKRINDDRIKALFKVLKKMGNI